VMIIIIVIVFLSKLIPDYIESTKKDDYSYIEEYVSTAYQINPSILTFNDDGVAILKMDTLYLGVTNGKDNWNMTPTYDSDFNQCVGYLIVKKDNNDFKVDVSHICDMLDY